MFESCLLLEEAHLHDLYPQPPGTENPVGWLSEVPSWEVGGLGQAGT